jgi:hypothetical protein
MIDLSEALLQDEGGVVRSLDGCCEKIERGGTECIHVRIDKLLALVDSVKKAAI